MASPRASIGIVLTLLAGAAIAAGIGLAYDGGAAVTPAHPTVKCPDAPVDLSGQTVSPGADRPTLDCANLRGTVFTGVDLSQVSMRGADLAGAVFTGDDLTQADFTGADLRGAHFDKSRLIQATLDGADARGASFHGADMSQADAKGTDFTGADLGGADMTQATLTGAVLRDADLTLGSVTQADLQHADLRGAKLWLTGSIQSQVDGVRVDPIAPGIVQVPILAAAVLWVLMAIRVARMFRRPDATPVPVRDALVRALVVGALAFGVGLFGMFILRDIIALWAAVMLLPAAMFAVVAALYAVVGRFAAAPPGSAAPAAVVGGFTIAQ